MELPEMGYQMGGAAVIVQAPLILCIVGMDFNRPSYYQAEVQHTQFPSWYLFDT